jgi:4-amino-4-deoxy-L-arabinose transferase-like glycosyltransferase
MRLDPARAALLGALFAAIVTLPGLGIGTLWDNSETAYGEVAHEILLTHDWVVMHLNGYPWFVQPPLYFWLAAVLAKIAGVGSFAMRLPSALATIGMGALTGYATARIAGGRAGATAAIVLSTALMQAIVGRLAIMDALLDCCVTAAILWWFRALEPAEPGVQPLGGRSRAFLGGAFALALGTLAKGPVAPVVVLLVIAFWIAWERREATGVVVPRPAILLAGLALYLAVALPWFVIEAVRVGPQAAHELILHYTVGRYTGVIENQRGPWWYYVPVLILGFFPWTAFLPVGFARAWALAQTRAGSFARLALVWTIVPLVFFSCAQTKLPNYVALLVPALAIVVALWFERLAQGLDRRAGMLSAATVPIFLAMLGFAIVVFVRTNRFEADTSLIAPAFAALSVIMLAGSLVTVAAIAVARWTPIAPYVLGVTATVLVLFIAFIAEPVAETLKPIPGFAQIIQARRTPQTVVALRSVSGGNSLVFYTQPGVRSLDDPTADFIALICAHPDVFVITREGDGAKLVDAATARGRRAVRLQDGGHDTLLRVDGPRCSTPD